MPDSALRYSLTKDEVVGDINYVSDMGANPNRVVDDGTIGVGKTINYTLKIWIDYSATAEEASGKTFKAKLRVEATQDKGEPVSEVVLRDLKSGDTYDDSTDTFITGEEPNNYIWYSGKLWRAVSVNNEEKTTKLVTQWNISAITYSSGSSAFEGSYMEDWLNDTTVDGFLGNLRNYENFIEMDSKWNATKTTSESKPPETTMVTDAVGLLNYYEYVTSYKGTTPVKGYLNNKLRWWLLTPYSSYQLNFIYEEGYNSFYDVSGGYGIRPSINLKSDVKIVDGDGTIDNPYRLKEDNDTDLSGTKINTRYSGEYVRFGVGENNLYMIVSHETEGLTKITSAEPLKDSGTFKTSTFGNSETFSSTNTIGSFLNGDYLKNYVGDVYSNMIENNTVWYLGTVGDGASYKLAKYTDVNSNTITSSTATAKVGLLRLGELGAGQYDRNENNTNYWIVTSYSLGKVWSIYSSSGRGSNDSTSANGVRPSINLKSNVVITSGDGTKENPFEVALAS